MNHPDLSGASVATLQRWASIYMIDWRLFVPGMVWAQEYMADAATDELIRREQYPGYVRIWFMSVGAE